MSPPPGVPHGETPEPPADPEAWTDEEWLDWLRATDGSGFGGGDDEEGGAGTRMTAFTRRPGARAIGAAMIGLRNALYGYKEDEIVIVADAGGDPPNDPDLHDVHLDPEFPERSEVVVHLRPDHSPGGPIGSSPAGPHGAAWAREATGEPADDGRGGDGAGGRGAGGDGSDGGGRAG